MEDAWLGESAHDGQSFFFFCIFPHGRGIRKSPQYGNLGQGDLDLHGDEGWPSFL